VRGRTLTYVGDGNNTCHALIHTAVKLGVNIRVCSPEGYEPNSRVVNEAMRVALEPGSEVTILNDPDAAAEGADAIYTDVWASMGQEDEIEERNGIFAAYQVDEDMMARAKPGALFMHCLPAHRGGRSRRRSWMARRASSTTSPRTAARAEGHPGPADPLRA
jgi:ornithine carbamoyltransferase